MCCISLVSCDNEMDSNELSPVELEILEMDNLIASQSGFDEEALIADLKRGTMKMTSTYFFIYGGYADPTTLGINGGRYIRAQIVLFMDKTCRDCFAAYIPKRDIYREYDWVYDTETRSITTHTSRYSITYDGQYEYKEDCSAKVLYYNAENHRLILEGDMFNMAVAAWGIERVRMSGYIDVDPAERERILEKYCNE